jgi:very-short-patch-repair endonuclease
MSDDKAQMWAYYWGILAPEMPRMTPEYEFAHSIHYIDAAGRKRTRGYAFDFADIPNRIAVEVDGGQHASGGGRHATDTDREKTNTASLLRWLVFHFSPDQLKKDPQKCVDMVRRAIQDSV